MKNYGDIPASDMSRYSSSDMKDLSKNATDFEREAPYEREFKHFHGSEWRE